MESGAQPDGLQEKEKEKKERMMARRKRVGAKLEAKRKAEAGKEPQEVSTSLISLCIFITQQHNNNNNNCY